MLTLVTPHAGAAPDSGYRFYGPEFHGELPDRFDDWYERGAEIAAAACARILGVEVLAAELPRDVLDLGRPFLERPPEVETLFGKSAVDKWSRSRLVDGGAAELRGRYYARLAAIREASRDSMAMVEVHEYGKKGSSYDQASSSRRPTRRPECAIIPGSPWNTSDLSQLHGLERLLPGSLSGNRADLDLAVLDAVHPAFVPGPSPYPSRSPWAVSSRFVAGRFFRWAGEQRLLPAETASRLEDAAWGDPLNPAWLDLPGASEFAARVNDWSADEGNDWADAFARAGSTAAIVVELRLDQRERAGGFGECLAVGLRAYLARRAAG